MTKYEMLSDDDLIRLSRMGDRNAEEFLLDSYRPMILHMTRQLHLQHINDADIEDFMQEGMIGLFNAMRDYDLESDASFSTFAHICVANNMKNALTYANRKKHLPLKNYVHFDYFGEDSEKHTNDSLVSDYGANNPEQLILKDEDIKRMYAEMEEKLSTMEKKVVSLYLSGYSRKEMASTLGKSEKSIDNALTRIRNKLKG